MTRKWLWACAAVLGLALLTLPALGIGGGQLLVFLLLLLCPLMHLLGGHRHGDHGGGGATGTGPTAPGRQEGEGLPK